MHDDYKDKGLVVLGINVQVKKDATIKAISDMRGKQTDALLSGLLQ